MWIHFRRRRRYFLGALLLLAVAGLWVAWLAAGGSARLSRRAADRLLPGMARADVEAALGAAGTNAIVGVSGPGRMEQLYWYREATFWAPPAALRVSFDDEERVVHVQWTEDPWLPHVWAQLKQRLRL